jgi:hypothetical protein
VLGVGGVPPSGVDAVVMNVAVTSPTAAGWLTVFPKDEDFPLAASMNFTSGLTVANLVVAKVGAGGAVSIANTRLPSDPQPGAGTVHVIADVVGYYQTGGAGSSLTSITPARTLDTRAPPNVPVQSNATITVDPAVGTGLPAVGSYSGVVANVTVVSPTQGGWLTVFPSNASLPLATSLNFGAGTTVANLVQIGVGADGRFKIANTRLPSGAQPGAGTVHVIVDIVGFFSNGSSPPPPPYTTAPQGTWTLASGSNGYVLGGFNNGTSDVAFVPSATFTLDQGSRTCWACSTTDVRALMSPDGTERHAAAWFDPSQVRGHLSFSAPFTGTLHLYAVDWDAAGRRETITVDDGRGPQSVDITTAFDQGAWTGFPVYVAAGGTINITVSRTAGPNAVLSGIFLGEPGAPPVPPPPAQSIGQYCAPSTSSASAYQTAIDNLRKAGTGWATADGSIPVPLPDGRTLYMYGDTFVGTVNSSGTISSSKYLVENSAVMQTGTCFNPLLRGSSNSRTAWIAPPASGQAYWPSSAVVDGAGNLQVFLMHVRYSDGFVYGMKIATFSLPSLTLQGISAQLPFTDLLRTYGTTALVDGGFAYLYSTHDQDQRLARVPLTAVTNANAYQFWNGSTWVSAANYNSAVALTFNNMHDSAGIDLHAPIAGLWAVRHGNGFLGTAMLVNAYSQELGLFTASSPQGPWTYIGNAATTPSNRFSYGALTTFRLQGMSPTPATIFSTNIQATPNTISEYGPRFVAPANVPPPLP